MVDIYGMEVRESRFAVTREPARKHEKKAGQSDNYHRRITKKWLKRFGQRAVPCMYRLGPQITGREVLLIHPELMPKLKAAVQRGKPQ